MNGATNYLTPAALLMAASSLTVDAQETSFQQRIADLDAKTAVLEKRFEDNAAKQWISKLAHGPGERCNHDWCLQ